MNEITPKIREAVSAVDFPIKLQMLFDPCRYKVLYGGRGGAKSWVSVCFVGKEVTTT